MWSKRAWGAQSCGRGAILRTRCNCAGRGAFVRTRPNPANGAFVRARCNRADEAQICAGRDPAPQATPCRAATNRPLHPTQTQKKRRRMPLAPSSLSTPLFFLHTHVENPIPVCYNGNWSLGYFSIYVHYNPNIIVPHWISFVKPSDQKWGMKKERYHERY